MTHASRHLLLAALLLGSALGCTEKKPSGPETPAPAASAAAADTSHGLTKEQAAQPLVKVGETTITLGEFAERLGSQSPYLRARYTSAERRREFLDNMVRFELLALEAGKRGFDSKEEVQRARRQMMVQEMMKDLFDENGVKLADISDADIEAYYKAHAEEFSKPEQVRASQIVVKTAAEAKSLLAQLKQAAPAAPKPGTVVVADGASHADMQLFRTLAEKHNLDPDTKDRFGDLRFFSQKPADDERGESVPAAVREAAFSIQKTGDLYAGVVESPAGFHVLMLTGRRAAMNRSLDDARRLIQNRLWRERRQAAIDKFVEELRKKASVSENAELMEKVVVDLKAPPPPSEVEEEEGGF
jgi:peptidyl-prolyl cis-trans isomerase C